MTVRRLGPVLIDEDAVDASTKSREGVSEKFR
jgi:hypothetical protein